MPSPMTTEEVIEGLVLLWIFSFSTAPAAELTSL
eukprot:CAMPEP_0194584904 /NCGR_PEP_ID=MMETSP0292-20121207/17374_1 /TAXON_ID=39354 /ORGANISM="Heterosigma akashiwo, Strain CCMP2393" /LENGTH=33 /DNA_ID= /DNA_START= /DNA_END= /DNA_ORIENTATION=